jgi:hypothetical protein
MNSKFYFITCLLHNQVQRVRYLLLFLDVHHHCFFKVFIWDSAEEACGLGH